MSNQSNKSHSTSLSQISPSWASTVSDYILQRRRQNISAYQTVMNISSSMEVETAQEDSQQEWLFSALFIALAQQLEEGHTVLTLSSAESGPPLIQQGSREQAIDAVSDHDDISLTSYHATLYQWQQRLLSILLSPLTELAEAQQNNAQGGIQQGLMKVLEQWSVIKRQSTFSHHDVAVLEQRHSIASQLYDTFISINQSVNNSKNSLSKFKQLIDIQPLISPSNNHNQTNPIRYQSISSDQGIQLTFWLHRTWQAEHTLAQQIFNISQQSITPLPITTNPLLNSEQQAAIEMANQKAFSIITGGPGTGKTFTVAQLVIALKEAQPESSSKVKQSQKASLALAAPTGKAAQRMQESLQAALDTAGVSLILQEAKTIHRLLGIGQSGQPRYNKDNPLSEDIVIVDEASMLGVELANHLVSAIKPGARLILLGDANQLAAVDAGAVLADLCRIPKLQAMHQQLVVSRRFSSESGIGQLARQINQTNTDMAQVWQLLKEDQSVVFYPVRDAYPASNYDHKKTELDEMDQTNQNKNSLSNYKLLQQLSKFYQPYLNQIKKILFNTTTANSIPKKDNDPTFITELFHILNRFRILTAGHHGQWGDHYINDYLSQWHTSQLKLPLSNNSWFHGRPVMVLQNSYELGLFNGDIGICLQTKRGLEVFFDSQLQSSAQGIAVNLLNDDMIATAYAMTIHKSQGSEFDHVAITFDDSNSRLLSKELIYTAVTRARKEVSIYSSTSAFEQAISTPTIRQTGLALQFDYL